MPLVSDEEQMSPSATIINIFTPPVKSGSLLTTPRDQRAWIGGGALILPSLTHNHSADFQPAPAESPEIRQK